MRQFIVLAFALASVTAWAQTYRWVDPATGRVVISDTPPPGNAKGISKVKESAPASEIQSFAVKRAAGNFPVTLYTTAECTTLCKQARDLLNGRGVPFNEKMLQKQEEAEELKKLLGEVAIPALTVGKQAVRGFEAQSYNNLLDLAGYPASAPPGSKLSGGLAK